MKKKSQIREKSWVLPRPHTHNGETQKLTEQSKDIGAYHLQTFMAFNNLQKKKKSLTATQNNAMHSLPFPSTLSWAFPYVHFPLLNTLPFTEKQEAFFSENYLGSCLTKAGLRYWLILGEPVRAQSAQKDLADSLSPLCSLAHPRAAAAPHSSPVLFVHSFFAI